MDKQTPQAPQIEDRILSSCFLFPENADEAVSLLKPKDFYVPLNRKVFATIQDLHEKGSPIDQVLVEEQTGREIFYDTRDASANIEHDANILKSKTKLREIIQQCQKAEHKAYNGDDPEDVISDLNTLFETFDDGEIQSFGDALQEAVERNMEVAAGNMTLGIKTGLDVDDVIGGYEDGKLYIIAARPAMGKSAYALNIMMNIASMGLPVGMLSLEMTSMSLANRILINALGIDGMKIRNGNISEAEQQKMMEVAGDIKNLPIYFDDNPMASPPTLRAKANIFKRKYGIGLLVVDYMQLMTADGRDRREQVDKISRTLKLIAKEMSIPVVALSQLSRAVENRNIKRPQLSDLRESGAIEQDADCVQFLYRPSEYQQEQYPASDIFSGSTTNICEIIVAKNREGQTGIKQQLFFANKMQFRNLDWKHNTNNNGA